MTLPTIVSEVCSALGIEAAMLRAASKKPRIVMARHAVVLLAREFTDATFAEIAGVAFAKGGRGTAQASYSVAVRRADLEFIALIEQCRAKFGAGKERAA